MSYNSLTDAGSQPSQLSGFGTDLVELLQNTDGMVSPFPMDIFNTAPSPPSGNIDEPFGYETALLHVCAGSLPVTDNFLGFLHDRIDTDAGLDLELVARSGRRASSDDATTPAQSRRRAQNRAAQRAFRERKERNVRELKRKLDHLTTTASFLQSENERLKLLLGVYQSENALLRASAAILPATGAVSVFSDDGYRQSSALSSSRSMTSGSDQTTHSTGSSYSIPAMDGIVHEQSQLLSASDAWDYLKAHPKYVTERVDIGQVCEQLKKFAQRNSTGPMFDKNDILRAIEEIGGSELDELL